MQKALLFSSFVLLFSITNAQNLKLKKADDYYSKVSYAEAAELYSDLLGSKLETPEMKSRLANCFYQIGESGSAEILYGQIIEAGEFSENDVYQFAQSLKENGKYNESDKWMSTYYDIANSDLRANEFISDIKYFERIEAQGAYFEMKELNINSENAEFGGYPFDKNQVYFVSNRHKRFGVDRFHSYNSKKFLDLYVAEVSEDYELENAFFKSRKVNKKFHEGPLCFSPDLKTVYFTRNNMSAGKEKRDEKGIQHLKIYTADVSADGSWQNERELSVNSKFYSVGHPTVSNDGKFLYFSSDMPGGFGGADIYKMEINGDGTYGNPQNLGEMVNTEGQEMFPWITSEGVLFLSSDGHTGLGGLDVYVVTTKKDGSFHKLMNVGKPVNSAKDDFALILSSDNVTGYVSSNRESGRGDDDIYSIKLIKPFKVNLSLAGVIADKNNGNNLPGAKIELFDMDNNLIATILSDANGAYNFDVEPDKDYILVVSKDDYFINSEESSTKNLSSGQEKLVKNLTLEKDPGLSLLAQIADSKTEKPLEAVTIQLVDNMTGKSTSYSTDSNGEIMRPLTDKKLNDRGSYNFMLSKEGYIPKTVTYNILFDREGQYEVSAVVDLRMDPVVEDLRDLIQINPINFDLGKWNIRSDAKIELDKIVEVMNKYPKMVVELGSHTDCRASKSFNMRLSDKRAKSSAAYIKSKITDPDRIYGKGYGESKLLNDCECEGSVKSDCSEEEHELNRRTEFKVISVGDNNVDVINNSDDSFDD